MMKAILPHIRVGLADDGRGLLVVDDLELYDVVEEFLSKQCLVFIESREVVRRPGGEVVTAVVSQRDAGALEGFLGKLDAGMVEAVYRLNNP